MEMWIKRFTCSVPYRGHDQPVPIDEVPEGWAEFVADDVQGRRRHDHGVSITD
jgi:hypothetical protein